MTTKLPKSRALATAMGLDKYQTGKPCKRGHNSPRWTSSNECIACAEARSDRHLKAAHGLVARYRRAHPEAVPAEIDYDGIVAVYRRREDTNDDGLLVTLAIPPSLGGMVEPSNLILVDRSTLKAKETVEEALTEVLVSYDDPLGVLREHRHGFMDLTADLPDGLGERLLNHVTALAEQL
ncbi:MAG TPA: hypothetical protein VF212_00935 [Longimicrobiales bacterium]